MATVGLMIAIPPALQLAFQVSNDVFSTKFYLGSNGIFPAGLGPNSEKTWVLLKHVVINSNQVIMVAVTAVCGFGLWAVVRHTQLGLQLRATVDKGWLAQSRGIRV